MASFLLPYLLVPVLEWVRNYYYQLYSLKVLGEAELGVFAVGIRLVQIFILISNRAIYGLAAYCDVCNRAFPQGKRLYRYYYRYSLLIYFMVFLIISLFSKEAVLLISNAGYEQAFRYVPLLLVVPLASSLYGHFSIGIWIAEKTKYVTLAYGIGCLYRNCFNALVSFRLE